jgi:hypothetical protein
MSESGPEREQELAELLREVRALRRTIDQMQAGQGGQVAFPPNYEVLVRSQPMLPPDYAVLVRQQPTLPPDYAVLVRTRPQLPPEYEVLVRPVPTPTPEPPAAEE